jgi:hypothetical protein
LPFDKQNAEVLNIYNDIKKSHITAKQEKEDADQEQLDSSRWNEAVEGAKKESEGWFSGKMTPVEWMKKNTKRTDGYIRKLETKYGGKSNVPDKPPLPKPAPPAKLPPLTVYQPGTTQYTAKADEYGYNGHGYNVSKYPRLRGVRQSVIATAVPILEKYGLNIVDREGAGYRNPNAPSNGAKNSQHHTGNALDINWAGTDKQTRTAIIRDFKAAGYKGFGVGPTSLHIDRRKNPASWSYYGTKSHTGKGGIMPNWAAQALRG